MVLEERDKGICASERRAETDPGPGSGSFSPSPKMHDSLMDMGVGVAGQ